MLLDPSRHPRTAARTGLAGRPWRHRAAVAAPLTISLSTGVGAAPTPLAAFDAALCAVGAGNLNLVRLSSVIPPGARLTHTPRLVHEAGWGDRLYCVYAEQHADEPGARAAAGVGWVRALDGSGAGLFVEHHGADEADVARQVRASLGAMTRARGGGFSEPEMRTVSAVCTDEPVCVVALAAYRAESWAA